MLVRLQSPTTAMMESAFRLAAQYGYAIDVTPTFGAITTHKPKADAVKADKPRFTPKATKPQPKAVKAVRKAAKPSKAPVKASEKPAPVETESLAVRELRAKGKALRAEAIAGVVRFSPKVFGDLRSRDVEKLTAAVRIAEGVYLEAGATPKAEKAPAKPKSPYRRIPMAERQRLSESQPTEAEMTESAEHIEAELHKALMAELPLLGESEDELEMPVDEGDAEGDETAELDFDHE